MFAKNSILRETAFCRRVVLIILKSRFVPYRLCVFRSNVFFQVIATKFT